MTGTPATHAWAAAEAVRALNHATLPATSTGASSGSGSGLVWASDADDVIAALHTLAYRLPQALDQIQAFLAAGCRAGSVGHDQGGDTGLSLDLIAIALDQAKADAARLAQSLDTARAETTHLTGTAGTS